MMKEDGMCQLDRRMFMLGAVALIEQTRRADPRLLARAGELARKAVESGDGGAYGAVVVKDGRIIAEGWNRTRATVDPTAHSEIDAIRNACKKLNTINL